MGWCSDLEQLCRYVTRPVVANEQISVGRAGQVVLKLKTPWRNDANHDTRQPKFIRARKDGLTVSPTRC